MRETIKQLGEFIEVEFRVHDAHCANPLQDVYVLFVEGIFSQDASPSGGSGHYERVPRGWGGGAEFVAIFGSPAKDTPV